MDVKKEDADTRLPPDYSLLDTRQINRDLWFAMLYPWLVSELRHISKPTEIGKLRVYEENGKITKVTVTLNDNVSHDVPIDLFPELGGPLVPGKPNRYAFTHQRDSGYVRILGRIVCDLDLKSDDLKKTAACREKVAAKAREPEQEKKKESKIASLASSASDEERKDEFIAPRRQEKERRLRKSREQISKELLQAFKFQPEWNINDLVLRIDQAKDAIFPVLRDLADFDRDANVWQLKEEYKRVMRD